MRQILISPPLQMRDEGSQRSGSLSTIQRQAPLLLKPVPQPLPSCADHCPTVTGVLRADGLKTGEIKELKGGERC